MTFHVNMTYKIGKNPSVSLIMAKKKVFVSFELRQVAV